MDITVDLAICQNLGQCVFAAPDIFDIDSSGELIYTEEIGEEHLDDAHAAADACPVQAIVIGG